MNDCHRGLFHRIGASLSRYLSCAVLGSVALAFSANATVTNTTIAVTSITETNYAPNASATLTLTFSSPETVTIPGGDWIFGLNFSGFTATCAGATITDVTSSTTVSATCGGGGGKHVFQPRDQFFRHDGRHYCRHPCGNKWCDPGNCRLPANKYV